MDKCISCTSSSTCTNCYDGYVYDAGMLFLYTGNAACKKCTYPCLTCTGTTVCNSCISPYILKSDNTNTCVLPSISNCLTYTSAVDNCMTCLNPYSLYVNSSSNKCYRCSDSNCLVCNSANITNCY
jgi:hypothetical protein